MIGGDNALPNADGQSVDDYRALLTGLKRRARQLRALTKRYPMFLVFGGRGYRFETVAELDGFMTALERSVEVYESRGAVARLSAGASMAERRTIPTTLPPRMPLTEPPLVLSVDSRFPESIDLDGRMTADGTIEYMGRATRQADGTYVCLARVGHALCRVEVRLTPLEERREG